MNRRAVGSITEHFKSLPDPRVERTKQHLLQDILTIAICAVICGADSWVEIEQFGEAKKKWFRTFLRLPNGIPSHDTFGRVFAALDPEIFAQCFSKWIAAVSKVTKGSVVAIDGKTLRRSFDTGSQKAAIHMVSAWADSNQIVLGQVKTEQKSNEITAIPKLLKMLELSGCIVTIDAMGCQKKIASHIIDKGADYVLSLKGNQGTMEAEVREFFDWAVASAFKDVQHDFFETIEKDHGREEIRRYWSTSEVGWFEDRDQWRGLFSFGMVETERRIKEAVSRERRFYISSLNGRNAKTFAHAVRSHWGIENKLHWVLDVAFREDDSRVRMVSVSTSNHFPKVKDHSAANFCTLRQIALNLLKQEKTAKVGIKIKRNKSGWSEDYLLKVLGI